MTNNLRVLIAETNEPYFNLATEDWIFFDMPPEAKVLFLWRNEKSVIVGRGQNVWSECDLAQAEEDGVHIVRRHSGGGAVYQDLGNTCFTFMGGKEAGKTTKELYARNNEILISALARFGIQATASGRNDIVVDRDSTPYKISGSAFRESKDRCFHHGTMLMNVDLTRLARYLTPDSKKLQAKGIKSVKSRVLNLGTLRPDLDHDSFCEAVIEEFFKHYQGSCEVERLQEDSLLAIDSLSSYHQKLKSWDWIYGKTPNFQHTLSERFPWGNCELHLTTDKGKITEVKVFSDALAPEIFDSVAEYLVGKVYSSEGVQQALTEHFRSIPEEISVLKDFYTWLSEQL